MTSSRDINSVEEDPEITFHPRHRGALNSEDPPYSSDEEYSDASDIIPAGIEAIGKIGEDTPVQSLPGAKSRLEHDPRSCSFEKDRYGAQSTL